MKKLIIVSILSLFMLVGCSNENGSVENNSNENTENNPSVEANVEQSENENKEEKDESNDETINIENTEEKNNSTEGIKEEVKFEEFKIYGFDKNVEFKTVIGTVSINEDLSKEEKLNSLFNEIYKKYGKNFKMEIKLREDNIVELNILNVDEVQGELTTSAQTEGFIYTFIDSLLQKEYKGDWISGVQVLNNGKIDPELGQGAFEDIYK